MRGLTRSALAAFPLALTLALAACGADDTGGGVASASGASTTAAGTAGPDQGGSEEEQGVRFAQCMREHGVDMEDPRPGEGIRITTDGADPETMRKAMEACRQYSPVESGKGGSDPEVAERMRRFAECMRANGVEDFPDPEVGQGGIRINKEIADDPDFAGAQEACQEVRSGGNAPGGQ